MLRYHGGWLKCRSPRAHRAPPGFKPGCKAACEPSIGGEQKCRSPICDDAYFVSNEAARPLAYSPWRIAIESNYCLLRGTTRFQRVCRTPRRCNPFWSQTSESNRAQSLYKRGPLAAWVIRHGAHTQNCTEVCALRVRCTAIVLYGRGRAGESRTPSFACAMCYRYTKPIWRSRCESNALSSSFAASSLPTWLRDHLVHAVGLEPTTFRLRVGCSSNTQLRMRGSPSTIRTSIKSFKGSGPTD